MLLCGVSQLRDVQTKRFRVGILIRALTAYNQVQILLQILSNALVLNRRPKANPHHNARIYNHVILLSCPTIMYLRKSPENLKRPGKGHSESFESGLNLKEIVSFTVMIRENW